ncbi:hypothetical protein AQJ43_09700 [Streptomyces avermitilis]|uniref:DUF485 domain-containing protein n=2 Tax=Streptomyces avermitilis TaxID=33903 RepID=Q82ND4_STRAW|nr:MULTISPECIES: DUF485 domain-containing protein [Streptomyces]KUN55204.1 hypothetical protein AQJ43_09700 [Streptomyces avermitilis]MYS96998.1 DUF485 domain-containing protein [Streptomyces sp. SID5469]OOV26689.1 hypothetical protein SM007_22885 [Streptomyces avermitilis]BAC69079.1 hypothetical protein SAVERM_1369 [Streptomyces avermitilis MA-4680 = NBRC 14893]BBJ49020.1 hypothetical protein SAVMC3_16490 [Streptomyces avermitilis]
MTHADDNRYPPAAPPGWPQPRTAPHENAPRHEPYGYDAPRHDSYGYDTPRRDSYGYDASPYDPYGQAPRHRPSTHEPHRHHADLAALRSAYRVLRRVSTLTALGSFVVYVVLSCYAPDLMGSKIAGELSLGMALGVLQLIVTFAAVLWYGRSAQRSVDPLARVVRERAVRPGRDAEVAR